MQRDYTHVFLGIVVFAGLAAALVILAPILNFDSSTTNRAGFATTTTLDDGLLNEETYFPIGEEYLVEFDGLEYVVTVTEVKNLMITLTIDGESHSLRSATGMPINPKHYLYVQAQPEGADLYFYPTFEAPTCHGLYRQTEFTLASNSICCDGQVLELPNCERAAQLPVVCAANGVTQFTLSCDGAVVTEVRE